MEVPLAPILTIIRPRPKASNLTTRQRAICIFGEYSSKDRNPTMYDLKAMTSSWFLSFGSFLQISRHFFGNILFLDRSKYSWLNDNDSQSASRSEKIDYFRSKLTPEVGVTTTVRIATRILSAAKVLGTNRFWKAWVIQGHITCPDLELDSLPVLFQCRKFTLPLTFLIWYGLS